MPDTEAKIVVEQCPECSSEMRFPEDASEVVCPGCNARFALEDEPSVSEEKEALGVGETVPVEPQEPPVEPSEPAEPVAEPPEPSEPAEPPSAPDHGDIAGLPDDPSPQYPAPEEPTSTTPPTSSSSTVPASSPEEPQAPSEDSDAPASGSSPKPKAKAKAKKKAPKKKAAKKKAARKRKPKTTEGEEGPAGAAEDTTPDERKARTGGRRKIQFVPKPENVTDFIWRTREYQWVAKGGRGNPYGPKSYSTLIWEEVAKSKRAGIDTVDLAISVRARLIEEGEDCRSVLQRIVMVVERVCTHPDIGLMERVDSAGNLSPESPIVRIADEHDIPVPIPAEDMVGEKRKAELAEARKAAGMDE